ncbi:MAG: hypothetical protein GKR94_09275 [Gammaproteobacteria bacterium]|nr:hypothetical protein [Gammaproteobacteria bacterium]
MNTLPKWRMSALALTLAFSSLHADEVILHDGSYLKGQFVGATSSTLRVEINAIVKEIPIGEVASIRFDRRTASAGASSVRHVVGTGATLRVRIGSTLSSQSARTGQRFRGVLLTELKAGEHVLAPTGQVIWGRVTRARRGQRPTFDGRLLLELSEVEVEGRPRPIKTSSQAVVEPGENTVEARRGEVRINAGATLEFRLAQPFIHRQARF